MAVYSKVAAHSGSSYGVERVHPVIHQSSFIDGRDKSIPKYSSIGNTWTDVYI